MAGYEGNGFNRETSERGLNHSIAERLNSIRLESDLHVQVEEGLQNKFPW